jgi:hypothetical protein
MRKGNDIYSPEKEQAGDTTQDAKVLNSLGGIFLLFRRFELGVFETFVCFVNGKKLK